MKIYLILIFGFVLVGTILFVSAGYEFPSNELDDSDGTTELNMTDNFGLYHFNNDSVYGESESLAYDFSGRGNNATGFVNNPIITNDSKLGDNAAHFDKSTKRAYALSYSGGVNDLSKMFETSQTFSMSAWVKMPVGSSGGYIITYGTALFSVPNTNFYLLEVSGNMWFSTRNAAGTTVTSTSAGYDYQDNQWHHVLATYNGTTQALYVDGVLKDSDAQSGVLNNVVNHNTKVLIGGVGYNSVSVTFNGTIDEVAFWNRTIGSTEALSIFTQQNATIAGSSCSPTSDQTLTDETLNCNIFHITGSSTTSLVNSILNASEVWIENGSSIIKDDNSELIT